MALFYLLCIFTFFTCFAAKEPPTVTIPGQGIIAGTEISKSRTQKIIGYYGIPYAQPPINKLRFAPPDTQSLPSWEGVRNMTDYLPACPQSELDYPEESKPFLELIYPYLNNVTQGSQEDCLYLNIFTPYGKPPPVGWATIIWFHPGNFTTGSPVMWNPHSLVYRNDVILVSFAYRLGILGFFTTMDQEAPGNFGLMDQQAAMMWIKNNIEHFRGNPDNICLMGYGTGGVSVGIHMINENSKKYFNKAIIMSTNILHPSVVKYPEEDKEIIETLAQTFSCDPKSTSKILSCLQISEASQLIAATVNIDWRPLIDANLSDTPFLPEPPKNYFERGDFHKVPFLTGYTNMEEILSVHKKLEADYSSVNVTNDNLQQLFNEIVMNDNPDNNTECYYNYDHLTDSVMFFYGPSSGVTDIDSLRKIMADFTTEKNYGSPTILLANYISKENSTFVYRFDMKPNTAGAVENIPEWGGVPHLYDLIYIWGMPYWLELDGSNWEVRDKRLSDTIMSFWTNFAKFSDPTKRSYAIKWDQFAKENYSKLLIIDSHLTMINSTNVTYKAFEFWNDYFPKVMNVSKQCCNAMSDASKSFQIFHILLVTTGYLHLI